MSAQLTYDIAQVDAYAGQVFNAHKPNDIESKLIEDVAGVGFGVVVSRGTDLERQVQVGQVGAFYGVTIRSLDQEGDANTGAIKWDQEEVAGVMRSGYIWVTVPSGCTAGDAANFTDGTGVVDAGVAGGGETQITGATFETSAAAGEVAVLKLV